MLHPTKGTIFVVSIIFRGVLDLVTATVTYSLMSDPVAIKIIFHIEINKVPDYNYF